MKKIDLAGGERGTLEVTGGTIFITAKGFFYMEKVDEERNEQECE